MDISQNKVIHFIGIGGAGMSAIAKIVLSMGYSVSGSDIKESKNTLRLNDMGATIFIGQDGSNLRKADVVVVSTAISNENPEYAHAVQEKMPVYHRAEMLNWLMEKFSKRVAVAGTHGKTTTTAMLTRILEGCGANPTYLIGADLVDFGGNASLGSGEYFVAESDESDGSFLNLNPNIAIITNMEAEHMSYYQSEERLIEHFSSFLHKVGDVGGALVVNRDDESLWDLVCRLNLDNVISFGTAGQGDVVASDIELHSEGSSFMLTINGNDFGEVRLQTMGRHNIENALAAIAVAHLERQDIDCIKKGLHSFKGASRRFQLIGEFKGVSIYDDYGHHPTEIKATLDGIKESLGRRLVCVFQPHRYSRTKDFLEEFPLSFDSADEVVITEVFSANESKIDGISGEVIVEKMDHSRFDKVHFVAHKSEVSRRLIPELRSGDVVVTMGAGDIHTVGKDLLSQLKVRGELH